MLKGEVGIGYLENGNVIAKLGTYDGVNESTKKTWKELPQIEGVFEDDVTLTYNFGKHTIDSKVGYKKVDAKGMTTSEWIIAQLADTKNPTITQPSSSLSASCTGSGAEIGSKITEIKWDGSVSYGSYTYGPSTGLGSSNKTWTISNDVTTDTSNSEDGTFAVDITLDQEASKTYATVTGKIVLDASNAAYAKNNIGQTTELRVNGIDTTHTANATATAYRKPFWAVLTPDKVVDVANLSSDIIRGLEYSGTATKGFPSSISVPVGSQMVIFAARAGAYSSLKATDDKAMNAEVGFTKVANAVRVKGANNFVTSETGDEANGALYDIWYVDWNPDKVAGYTGIGSAKQLTLTWA
jgi:hypothetical protein